MGEAHRHMTKMNTQSPARAQENSDGRSPLSYGKNEYRALLGRKTIAMGEVHRHMTNMNTEPCKGARQ